MKTHFLLLTVFFYFIPLHLFATENDSAAMSEYDIKIKEGEFYLYHQNYDRSIDIYSELLKTYPKDALVNYRIGVCYYFIEKHDEADKYFEIANDDSWYHSRIILFKELHQSNPASQWW
jgi:tetratricopeptide (TPR) repeat protein